MTVAVIGLVAAPMLAAAQGFGGPGRGGHGWHGHRGGGQAGFGLGFLKGRMAERLDLSQEQRDQIEAILDQGRPTIENLRQQLREGRETFRSSHQPGDFNEAEVRAHAQAQAQIRTEIMVETMRLKSQAFAVLTPEQQDQLVQLRDEMGSRGVRRGGGCGRGGGS
jgi:Spy/CpxP family protein refolding chaperone